MVKRLESKGISSDKIHFIPNWMDERIVYPIDRARNELRQKWGVDDKFVVLYSGNMGVSHCFDDILLVAGRLKEYKDIIFVFIGDGVRRCEIERAVKDQQLSNVLLLPFQDMDVLAQSLSAGDLHLVTLREEFTGLVVPSKSYGILAAGRPILYQGRRDGEIARMVREEDVGFVVPLNDPDALRKAILRYYRSPALADGQGVKARRLAEGRYSRKRSTQRYSEVLLKREIPKGCEENRDS
jgi:glycosyltransferase involved in cell wall biosynthesis